MSLSPATDIVGTALRRVVPLALTFACVLLAYMPGMMPSLAPVMPPLPLIPLVYFSIHRPDWFGAVSAFILGLLVDILLGAPPGVTAGLYAAVYLLLRRQQRFFKGSAFHVLWAGYGAVQLLVTLGQSLAWWLLADVTPSPLKLLGINILGLAVFPVGATALSKLHKWLRT